MPNHFKNISKKTLSAIGLLLMTLIISNDKFAQRTNLNTSTQKVNNSQLIYETEKLLAEKGYWITKVDKTKDASTFHALVAFQKVEGRKRNGILSNTELEAIRNAVRPNPAYIGETHIEIDLKRQVLFLVNDKNIVTHILPVSTGSGKTYYENGKKQIAYTPRGIFRITRQIKGIRKAPLGTLYDPNYFYNGVAIHGSNSIPFYPASHGCVRIPRFASREFSELVSVGMTIIVYENVKQAKLLVEQKDSQEDILKTQPLNMPCETDDAK